MNLLLVEDDEAASMGVTWALNAEGHRVKTLHTGRPVFGMIAHMHPDAIILDVSLPDLDGVTVAKLVRGTYPYIPIVFTTGHGTEYPGLAEGAAVPRTALLQKPYEIATLIQTIEDIRDAEAVHS